MDDTFIIESSKTSSSSSIDDGVWSLFFHSVSEWHLRWLPPPLDTWAGRLLLQHVPYAEEWLVALTLALLALAVVQTKAFAKPHPVPLKRLPKRPCVSIQFQPDDPVTVNILKSNTTNTPGDGSGGGSAAATSTVGAGAAHSTATASSTNQTAPYDTKSTSQSPHLGRAKPSFIQRMDGMSQHLFRGRRCRDRNQNLNRPIQTQNTRTEQNTGTDNENDHANDSHYENRPVVKTVVDDEEEDDDDDVYLDGLDNDVFSMFESNTSSAEPRPDPTPQNLDFDQEPNHGNNNTNVETPFSRLEDLPDSFAPLLSSSLLTLGTQHLTADLIHACQVEAGVRLRPGRHEIPLDKDDSRPQLVLEVPSETGCRMAAVIVVGSDGLSNEQDMQVSRSTMTRSKPMVKHAGLVLDPPLALSNVAPTLIHFPTLFEDRNMIPVLRSRQLIRFVVDFVVSISSFLEQCLWIIESQCQIHLSKVRITPLYKGCVSRTSNTDEDNSPEWRLSLAFSGHVLLFGWIPIPFISVTLPSFIIPQPHALLEFLLSSQPLASARLRRENIAEERIVLAVTNTIEAWNTQLKLVATPPAVAVDVTLPGGVSIAVEIGLWRDHQAGRNREQQVALTTSKTILSGFPNATTPTGGGGGVDSFDDGVSINSMSSWTTKNDKDVKRSSYVSNSSPPPFDANHLVPWFLELSAKGTISHEKMSVHILKFTAIHPGGSSAVPGMIPTMKSQFNTRGSFAVWKLRPGRRPSNESVKTSVTSPLLPRRRPRSIGRNKALSHPELMTADSPSVVAIFLYPDETSSFHSDLRMLQYDYVFDVSDDSKLDAVTVSLGATHPMLNGGTMITTILDSIYAYGSIAAHEDSVLDPIERRRKRNILRHLPATDFTFGIQNIFIPPESDSFSDDGQSLFLPEIDGGRMMIRFLGGTDDSDNASIGSNTTAAEFVAEGIKLVVDFEIPALVMHAESLVKEFPELDIYDGVKLYTHLSGVIAGSVKAHLRPQKLTTPTSTIGPNVFNPLEAYEIDFSCSSLSIKMKECSSSLGHRRIMFPSETTFTMSVVESVVDMGFEGKTKCELSWDFQGLSPILQVTTVGQSAADALPENKVQVSLLISPLRQGRFSLSVSSVGGINITKAATSRDDKDGLYDWKFFNALISPDEESMGRIMDVLHDKPTVHKLLQVVKVVNEDLHKFLRYSIEQFRRAKEILDQEGVSDPGHAIPMYKMARLISLFLTGDVGQVDSVLPIVRRVVDGDGLDVVKVKDLLRQHLEHYDEWTPEIDRAVSWAAAALGPVASAQPYVEDQLIPLAEQPHNAAKFEDIPSASQLYETLMDEPHLPLDPSFSNLASRVAPYLSFKQVAYMLEVRASTDWQPSDLRRIRYVYSIKRKVREIAESYGGLSFLPQSFFLSVFLGEATRTSLRATRCKPTKKRMDSSLRSVSRSKSPSLSTGRRSSSSTFSRLRRRRVPDFSLRKVIEEVDEKEVEPLSHLTSFQTMSEGRTSVVPQSLVLPSESSSFNLNDHYELGDSLLGPQEVAILLQAGLTSVMKSSTVVQLNQRMLLDLICSQPRTFAIAVLSEIGNTPRGLTSALMALLELDQTAFQASHQIDVHSLIESWLPELKIPRREDHMAGGRWARQSYYDALFAVAVSISEDAETYMALKSHVQRVRLATEADPLPLPREETAFDNSFEFDSSLQRLDGGSSKLASSIQNAQSLVALADEAGNSILDQLFKDEKSTKRSDDYAKAVSSYRAAFDACAFVLSLDKYAFQSTWLSDFYRRNYDALMILSMFDNVVDNVDNVRYWLSALLRGSKTVKSSDRLTSLEKEALHVHPRKIEIPDSIFLNPEKHSEQDLIDAIIQATIFDGATREKLQIDPLVRLLIRNSPGQYNFVIVSAAGVVTDGKKGLELKDAFERLEKQRGVKVIRADTATARSIEYNASKVEEAIESAVSLDKPYGLLGYSQGCANALMAESMLLSGTPTQRCLLSKKNSGLICRQLLFSAANGSFHATAMDRKVQRLISMCEDFFKSQAGYFSRALASSVLETLNSILDSAHFHKTMGGAQSFLPDGCRTFWQEAQHIVVPTCTLRGVMEMHTTPESLEMLSNLLTKQSGSALHDSQVHVFDAVGYPVYHLNRNGRLLKRCAVGEGAIQRTHHWSPLAFEVEFVRTARDIEMASFDCAKDRHVFPWVEVNKRFGFIKFTKEDSAKSTEVHPLKLVPRNL